ncbi:MAG: ABC transporter substrate-binding protein [Desulfovibrionaceae bacterium]|nr:ABC transporter substrate-binding protein [Desulfovibrionaceae bacterium]
MRYLLTAIFLVLAAGCAESGDEKAEPQRDVALLQLGKHEVIDQVIKGTIDRLNEIYHENINIKIYNANFDMSTLDMQAKQMVASEPDVLVSVTTPATQALMGANRGTLPMVFTFVSDPSKVGYTHSDVPKNVTGISDQVNYSGTIKLIEMLLPGVKNIGYLVTRSESNAVSIQKAFEQHAHQRGLTLHTHLITRPSDVRVAAELIAPKVECFLFGGDNTIASKINVLINVAEGHGLPVFACDQKSVEQGALAAYSVDYLEMGHRTGEIVGLVLSGSRPETLEVEQKVAKKLVINKRAAKKLMIKFSNELESLADWVVE